MASLLSQPLTIPTCLDPAILKRPGRFDAWFNSEIQMLVYGVNITSVSMPVSPWNSLSPLSRKLKGSPLEHGREISVSDVIDAIEM